MIRRHFIILLCAVMGLLAWKFLPGTAVDRGFFSLTVRCFAKPPLFISGQSGYTLRTLKTPSGETPERLPTIVTLGDDPNGFFQSSPPSPVDFAIILKNLKRLGQKGPVLAIPLAWDEADKISLIALDQQLDALPDLVTCAPLTRNPIPTPIPPAFRRASIPVNAIRGNTKRLPIVNRIPIPDVIFGNETSLAGFSTLESEPSGSHPHLLAQWEGEDRIVLALPLLAAMNACQVSAGSLEVHLGKYISFSKNGPYIPIDEYGRLAFKPAVVTEKQSIPAPDLIDAPDDLFTKNNPSVVILRNDLSSSQASSGNFSKSLVGTVVAMSDPSYTSEIRTYPRLSPHIELLLLASLLSLIYGLGNYPALAGRISIFAIGGLILALHFILVAATNTWPPTLPACIMIAIGTLTSVNATKAIRISKVPDIHKNGKTPSKPVPLPSPRPAETKKTNPAHKTTSKGTTTKKPAKKFAKKVSTKTAAKKVEKTGARKPAKKAARKTPAKKSPPKSGGI